ncbi:hypothetical protein ACSS6W_000178 [Trichoderma asperelloides]
MVGDHLLLVALLSLFLKLLRRHQHPRGLGPASSSTACHSALFPPLVLVLVLAWTIRRETDY